jgi:hypothetical protein
MVAYSFQPRFVYPILAGHKRQTIRADRKRHARDGEALQLYTGQRTRECRLLGRAVCESTWPIVLDFEKAVVRGVNFNLTQKTSLDRFARDDGFTDWAAMVAFWQENHDLSEPVFTGVIIRWRDFKAEGPTP